MTRKSRFYRRSLAIMFLTASTSGFVGCKSSMPSMKWMSWNRTPNPETLAAKGPSVTYPTPGATQTPKAVASHAAGTTPSNSVASSTVDPAMGYAAPATFAATPKPTSVPGGTAPKGVASNNLNPSASTAGASYAAAQANGYLNNTPYVPGGASNLGTPAASMGQPNHISSNNLALGGAPTSSLPQMPSNSYAVPTTGVYSPQVASNSNMNTQLPPSMKTPVPAISTSPSPYFLPSSYAAPSGLAASSPSSIGVPNSSMALPPAVPASITTTPAMTPGTDSGYRTAGNNYGYGVAPASTGQADASGTMTNPYARPQPTPSTSGGSYRPGSTNRATGYSVDTPAGSVYR